MRLKPGCGEVTAEQLRMSYVDVRHRVAKRSKLVSLPTPKVLNECPQEPVSFGRLAHVARLDDSFSSGATHVQEIPQSGRA